MLNFSIFRFRCRHKKRTKETPRSPLFTRVTARFARVCEKKKCVIYVCSTRERERESIQIFGTTKLFAIFFSILDVKESNATTRLTPLLCKAQTLA